MLMTSDEWRKYRKWRIGFAVVFIAVGGGGLAGLSRHHGVWDIWSDVGFALTGALLLADWGHRLILPAMLGASGASQYASALRAGQQFHLFSAKLLLAAAASALLAVTLGWIAERREAGASVVPDEDVGQIRR